jgi:hypothetical protein
MNTLNKVITWNPLREMDEAQNRLNRFFLGGFPSRIGSGEIHSLAVADWSPEVDISEDDQERVVKFSTNRHLATAAPASDSFVMPFPPSTGPSSHWRVFSLYHTLFWRRYNSLVEIPGIAICLAERRNMVLWCFQDGFLAHVHKHLGFLITDPVDMLR